MGSGESFAFGPFRLVVDRRELRLHGSTVPLGPRAFDLLLALVRRQGELVGKYELLADIWAGTVVEENNLHVQVSAVRKALAKGGGDTRYLQTIPGRGYRFLAAVQVIQPSSAQSSPPPGPYPGDPTVWSLPNKPAIAVLPFANMSGDPEQEYFADGIVEEIITALSRFSSLFVIARNSSFTYKGRPVHVTQVARELGVRYVLEGSVRKARRRVRITGQLIEAEHGTHIWADRYDGTLHDIFALQDLVTTNVVSALVPKLHKAEIDRALKKSTDNLDAYDLYLRALAAFYTWTRESNDRALDLLAHALDLEPHFVSAIITEENCWAARYAHGWSPMAEAIAQSTRCARLAVHIDPYNAEALAILARRTPSISQDYDEAVSLAERAVAINPNSAFAWRCTAYALVFAAQPQKALQHCYNALRLSPRDPRAYDALTALALARVQLGNDTEAVAAARKALQQNPGWVGAWRVLTAALALAGHSEQARDALEKTMHLDPTFSLRTIATRLGFSEQARTRLFEGWRRAGVRETP